MIVFPLRRSVRLKAATAPSRVAMLPMFVRSRPSRTRCLKHFRRVAARYDKQAANFLAMIQLASMRLWLRAYESTA